MNALPATIAAVETAGSISHVDTDVAGLRLTATLVGADLETEGWAPGQPVTLLFAETEVALAKNLSGLISLRNRIPAAVVAIERGRILARITLEFAGHRLVSIITTRASQALSLVVGDHVEAMIKANDMNVVPASVGAERGGGA